MLFFGKKNEPGAQLPKSAEGEAEPLVSVRTMPQLNARDFTNGSVGGGSPENVPAGGNVGLGVNTKPGGMPPIIGAQSQNTGGSKKNFFIAVGAGVFVVFLVGVSYYYIQQGRSVPQRQVVQQIPQAPVEPEEPVAPQEPAAPTEESQDPLSEEPVVQEQPTSTPSLSETIVTSTPQLPPAETISDPESSLTFLNAREYTLGSDVDGDQLSDREEDLFLTVNGNPDTDGDTFPDGWEIVNLYNPAAGNASRVDANQAVTTLSNQEFVYSFYAPRSFLVDTTIVGRIVLTAPTGEFVSISVQPNPHSLNIRAWLKEKYGAEADRITLNKLTTKNGLSSWVTADGLMRYMVSSRGVIVMRYELGTSPTVNYRQTMEMMAASFTFEAPTVPLLNEPPALPPQEVTSTTPQNQ